MPNYIRPRGTLDLYENQAQIYQTIIQTCQKIAQLYGYQMIQTPMFESTTLFSRTTGESSDIVTKEMYQFLKLHRCKLLKTVHQEQKKIDYLDYLVYMLKKEESENEC